MGAKRASVRTLPSGERVTHHPPDDAHPEGRMDLLTSPEASPLRNKLDAALESNRAAHEELKVAHLERIEVKQVSQESHGLPPEKSAL